MTEKQYHELPTHFMLVQESFRDEVYLYTADQMRAYADADRAMRATKAATQPAAPASQDAEDAARLDYLIESRAIVVSDPDSAPGYWLEFISPGADRWVQIGEYPTPRAAIDAARIAKEGGA